MLVSPNKTKKFKFGMFLFHFQFSEIFFLLEKETMHSIHTKEPVLLLSLDLNIFRSKSEALDSAVCMDIVESQRPNMKLHLFNKVQ